MYGCLIRRALRRSPDFIIGQADAPYLKRWWVIPRNRFFNIYLHNILRSDDDRALHDHPWWNVSIVLRGGYREVVYAKESWAYVKRGDRLPAPVWLARLTHFDTHERKAGSVVFRSARKSHRLELRDGETDCWTLFITGPVLRNWGFWCPKGWVRWQDFASVDNGVSTMSRGCGEQ